MYRKPSPRGPPYARASRVMLGVAPGARGGEALAARCYAGSAGETTHEKLDKNPVSHPSALSD